MTTVDRPDRDRGSAAVPETGDAERGEAQQTGQPARHARRWLGPLTWLAMAVAVLVVPLGLAVGITWAAGSGGASSARIVAPQELEDEYGIKVDLVAVIADGGLVETRFTVTDEDKAAHVLHDATQLPALYVESSGAVLRTQLPKAHKMTVLDGASYFVLYPNSGGAIQRGTPVSVVIDTVRLAPVDAQS